jgi:hypothetical protein
MYPTGLNRPGLRRKDKDRAKTERRKQDGMADREATVAQPEAAGFREFSG